MGRQVAISAFAAGWLSASAALHRDAGMKTPVAEGFRRRSSVVVLCRHDSIMARKWQKPQ